MAFFRHLGKKKREFQFSIVITSCDNLKLAWKDEQPLFCSVTRGSKVYQTKVALVESAAVKWNEALSIKATMYKVEKRTASGTQTVWDPKEFLFAVKTDAKDDTLIAAKIDLARYVHETGQLQTPRVVTLPVKGKEFADTPTLRITIRSYDCACPPTSPFKNIDTESASPRPVVDATPASMKSFAEEDPTLLSAETEVKTPMSAARAEDDRSRDLVDSPATPHGVGSSAAAGSAPSEDSDRDRREQDDGSSPRLRPPPLRVNSHEARDKDTDASSPASAHRADPQAATSADRRNRWANRTMGHLTTVTDEGFVLPSGSPQRTVSDAFDRAMAKPRRGSVTRIDEALEDAITDEVRLPAMSVVAFDGPSSLSVPQGNSTSLSGLLETEQDSLEEEKRIRGNRKMSTGSVEGPPVEDIVSSTPKPRVKRGFSRFASGEVRVGSRASRSGPASQFDPPAVSAILEDDELEEEDEGEEEDKDGLAEESDDEDDAPSGQAAMSVAQMKRLAALSGQQYDSTVAHRMSVHRAPSISAAS